MRSEVVVRQLLVSTRLPDLVDLIEVGAFLKLWLLATSRHATGMAITPATTWQDQPICDGASACGGHRTSGGTCHQSRDCWHNKVIINKTNRREGVRQAAKGIFLAL